MKSLGEYLQTERLNKGISLEEIAAETKISLGMLQAIEAGNTQQLPAPVLVKGFLRSYAQQIGLDPEEVILKYQDLIEQEDTHREALEKFHRRMRPTSPRRRKLVPLVIVAVLACLVALVWWSNRSRVRSLPLPPEVPAEAPPEKTTSPDARLGPSETKPGAEEKVSPPEQPSEEATQVSPATPGIAQPGPAARAPAEMKEQPATRQEAEDKTADTSPVAPLYVLRAEALEPTWLYIIIDESKEFEYLLQTGENLTWRANSGFTLHVGNAGGLRLHLNGRPLKPLGASGEVVHIHLPDPSLVSAGTEKEP